VLSDVHVGRQSGAELLSHLRSVAALTVVPFAFITATTDWQDRQPDAGATRIIQRPIEPAELLHEVQGLLRSPAGA
jgi:DNA-binding response OmpR family regulator